MQIYNTIIQKSMKWQGLREDKISYNQAPSRNMGCRWYYIRKKVYDLKKR